MDLQQNNDASEQQNSNGENEHIVNKDPKIVRILLVAVSLLAVLGVFFYLIYPSFASFLSNKEKDISFDEQQTATRKEINTEIVLSDYDLKPLPFQFEQVMIDSNVSEDFSINEIQNISDMEEEYGFTFSEEELKKLEANKFIIKNLTETNLSPIGVGDYTREFVALYDSVNGNDIYERNQANSVFYTTDVVMNLFSILSVELMKEAENKKLYPLMKELSSVLYEKAQNKVEQAEDSEEREEWIFVRNYFAIPYALLSTAKPRSSPGDFWSSGEQSVLGYLEAFTEEDKSVDSFEAVALFVEQLGLDKDSEEKVTAEIKQIYDAPAKGLPYIFTEGFEASDEGVTLSVPYSLFKPRGTYTTSSLRRQYFRSVQWYQQIPFLLKSETHTTLALRIAELVSSDQEILNKMTIFENLITALVGESDDMEVSDYIDAYQAVGNTENNYSKVKDYLLEHNPPARIKGMPAIYDEVGEVTVEEVLLMTMGMRFISQKFIPDSYWTGRLTQGDEKPAVQGMKLPLMPSSLEVMVLLNSHAAKNLLPYYKYYNAHKDAIDIRLKELAEEASGWDEDFWLSSQGNGVLWTIRGMFEWYNENKEQLPPFMASPLWDTKNLLTGSGFWTEMRHTNILYAKQSFAERGGGGDCESKTLPPAAKGYIEPNPEVYARLYHVVSVLENIYKSQKIKLDNLNKLTSYKSLIEKMLNYTKDELSNKRFVEVTDTKEIGTNNRGEKCLWEVLQDTEESKHWEDIRIELTSLMLDSMPIATEGPVLPMKDKRAAVIADVHTGYGDIYLEEGTGVPRVIFVAVKDSNGPRLTVGFTYSHYEFESNDRLTDEQWQERFYVDDNNLYQIKHKPKTQWPMLPEWYHELLGTH